MSARRIGAWMLAIVALVALGVFAVRAARRDDSGRASSGTGIRLAVLGDSDSHSYRDRVNGVSRGGAYHATTYQWTEVLDRLRSRYIDQGGFGEWGSRGIVARARAALGLEAKTPRKEDFRWNYAWSGARCASLVSEWPQQTRWLVSALEAEPDAWADGVVVLKIGVNDIGQRRHLDAYAASGAGAPERAIIAACARETASALDMIRAASATVRVLVVGVADDSSWPAATTPPRSAEEIARVREVLDAFDDALRATISGREHVAFMDDRSWYYDHWADRDAEGSAQTSGVRLGGSTAVTNTQGDSPVNLMLADGHAGTVANGFWARELVRALAREFDVQVPELSDAEIAALADPRGDLGIAP